MPSRGAERLRTCAAALLGALVLCACNSDPQVDYNWNVRPILSQNCFRCHGLATSTRKAGLRLDIAASAYGRLPQDQDTRAIVPGRPEESEVIGRLPPPDPADRMPPRDSHK